MQVNITHKELHLAAFMKANGAELLSVKDGFLFETDETEEAWRIRHSNSCCVLVDNEMLSMKRMLRSRG